MGAVPDVARIIDGKHVPPVDSRCNIACEHATLMNTAQAHVSLILNAKNKHTCYRILLTGICELGYTALMIEVKCSAFWG